MYHESIIDMTERTADFGLDCVQNCSKKKLIDHLKKKTKRCIANLFQFFVNGLQTLYHMLYIVLGERIEVSL